MLRILTFLALASLAYSSPIISPSSLYASVFKNWGYFPSHSYSPIRIPLSYTHQSIPYYFSYPSWLQQSNFYQIPSFSNYIQPFSYLNSYDPYLFWWNYALKHPFQVTIPQFPQHSIPTLPAVPTLPIAPTVPTVPTTPIVPEHPVTTDSHVVPETKPNVEDRLHETIPEEHVHEELPVANKEETPAVHELGASAKVEHVPPFIQ